MKPTIGLTVLAFFLLLSCRSEENPDLTTEIVGTYQGSLTRYLGTDSAFDINNQRMQVVTEDFTHVRLIPLAYPDASPADSLELTALLTPTPYSFIQSKGVMLTIDAIPFAGGQVEGVPYSFNFGGIPEEHGFYDRETGRLLYTIEVDRGGELEFELFEGWRE